MILLGVRGDDGNDLMFGGSDDDLYNVLSHIYTSGDDTISDTSGDDTANFAGSDTTDATWTAVDSDADTYLDQLVIDFGSGDKVTIEDYFDNTTTDDDTSGAGSGFIETLVFDDDSSVNLVDVQTITA